MNEKRILYSGGVSADHHAKIIEHVVQQSGARSDGARMSRELKGLRDTTPATQRRQEPIGAETEDVTLVFVKDTPWSAWVPLDVDLLSGLMKGALSVVWMRQTKEVDLKDLVDHVRCIQKHLAFGGADDADATVKQRVLVLKEEENEGLLLANTAPMPGRRRIVSPSYWNEPHEYVLLPRDCKLVTQLRPASTNTRVPTDITRVFTARLRTAEDLQTPSVLQAEIAHSRLAHRLTKHKKDDASTMSVEDTVRDAYYNIVYESSAANEAHLVANARLRTPIQDINNRDNVVSPSYTYAFYLQLRDNLGYIVKYDSIVIEGFWELVHSIDSEQESVSDHVLNVGKEQLRYALDVSNATPGDQIKRIVSDTIFIRNDDTKRIEVSNRFLSRAAWHRINSINIDVARGLTADFGWIVRHDGNEWRYFCYEFELDESDPLPELTGLENKASTNYPLNETDAQTTVHMSMHTRFDLMEALKSTPIMDYLNDPVEENFKRCKNLFHMLGVNSLMESPDHHHEHRDTLDAFLNVPTRAISDPNDALSITLLRGNSQVVAHALLVARSTTATPPDVSHLERYAKNINAKSYTNANTEARNMFEYTKDVMALNKIDDITDEFKKKDPRSTNTGQNLQDLLEETKAELESFSKSEFENRESFLDVYDLKNASVSEGNPSDLDFGVAVDDALNARGVQVTAGSNVQSVLVDVIQQLSAHLRRPVSADSDTDTLSSHLKKFKIGNHVEHLLGV